MGKRLAKKCLLVVLSLALVFCMAIKPAAADGTVTADNVKITDLFWGYPSYLNTQNHILSNAISTGKGILDNLPTSSELIIQAQSILKKHTDSVYLGSIVSIFGFESALQKKCDAKAAELLLQAAAYEPEVMDAVVKSVGNVAKELQSAGKECKNGVDFAKNFVLAKQKFTDEQLKDFNTLVKENTALISTVEKTTGIAMDTIEFVELICFCEALNDEVLDYINENGGTELKQAIAKYNSYKETNYLAYIADKYLTEKAIPKIFDLKGALLKKFDLGTTGQALFAVCEAVLKTCAEVIGWATELGDAEDYLVACSLYSYMLEMQTAIGNLRSEIVTTPIISNDVLKYKMGYGVYVASVKAFVKSVKSVDKDSSTQMALDSAITSIENHGTYELQIERCMERLRNDLQSGTAKERTVDPNRMHVITGEIQIKNAQDEIEADTIYTSNGKIYYGLDLKNGVQLIFDADAQIGGNVRLTSESNEITNLTIENGVAAEITGDLITVREWGGNRAPSITVKGRLKIDGNLDNTGSFPASNTTIEGENARLEIVGDAQCSGTMTGGTAIFKKGLVGGFTELGTGKVILETPAGSSADAGKIQLISMKEDTDFGTADITITQNAEGVYEFSGNAPSHEISLESGSYSQSGETKIKGLDIKSAANFILYGIVQVDGNVQMASESSTYDTSLTVADGASAKITADLITIKNVGGHRAPLITVKGCLSIGGDKKHIGSYGADITTIEGENARLEIVGDAQCSGTMTGGTAIFKKGLVGGFTELGTGKVILETPSGSNADAGKIQLISMKEDTDFGTADITITQNAGGIYEFSGNAPSHEISLESGSYSQSGETKIKGLDIKSAANVTLCGTVQIDGNVQMASESSTYDTSLTVANGASSEITADLITVKNVGGHKAPLITVKGCLSIGGDKKHIGSYGADITTVEGENAEFKVYGNASLGTFTAAGNITFGGTASVDATNAQKATYHITGTNAGDVTIGKVSLTRTEGVNPNLKVTYTDGIYNLSADTESSKVVATDMTLGSGSYKLESGIYDIADTTIGSDAVADMNRSITFDGNLNVSGGLMQMTSDGAQVQVNGNYNNSSSKSHEGSLTAGRLSVAGDFTQSGSYANFAQSGNHVLELNGTSEQTIAFASPQNNILTTLEISNVSGIVAFTSPVRVGTLFDHNRNCFALYNEGTDSVFVDYDGDGRQDHVDIEPTDPAKTCLAMKIATIEEQKYTGEAITPKVTVTAEDGTVLEIEKDYTTMYADNVKHGEAKVIVTGLGFYGETEEATFLIVCEHEYGEGVVTTPPTEEAEGVMTYTCQYCGEEKTEGIPKLENESESESEIESEEVTEPGTSESEPVTEPTTEPGTSESEPVTELTTEPGTSESEPITEPTTEPDTSESEPVTEPTTEPDTSESEPVTEPITQPSTPETEPATQPSIPETEPETQPSTPSKPSAPTTPTTPSKPSAPTTPTTPSKPTTPTTPSKPVTPTLKLVKTVKGKDYSVTIAKTQVTGNGKSQKPKITVKYKNKKLKTKYYTVKYSSNKYTGLATVTVKGKSSYKSKIPSTKIQFVITPKKMKAPTVKAGKGTAKVSWKTEKNATGYQIQISMNKKFKSGVQQINMASGKKSTTVSKLTSKKTYYVRTRAYKTIQGTTFYGKWSSVKKVKIK